MFPGATPKKPTLRIDGIKTAVRPDLHPGNIVAEALGFPARNGRPHHGQIGFTAGRGKGGGDMISSAFRIGQTQNQHMLGHPAFAPAMAEAMPQGQAFFPQERIAAVT